MSATKYGFLIFKKNRKVLSYFMQYNINSEYAAYFTLLTGSVTYFELFKTAMHVLQSQYLT